MHDWTLISIKIEWAHGRAQIELRNPASEVAVIRAEGLIDLQVPRVQGWGPSVSVNQVSGPSSVEGGKQLLVEMQSGDVIKLVASAIFLPPNRPTQSS